MSCLIIRLKESSVANTSTNVHISIQCAFVVAKSVGNIIKLVVHSTSNFVKVYDGVCEVVSNFQK